MKLTIKSPENKGWTHWRTWDIRLNDVLLDGLTELVLSFKDDEIATASMTIEVDNIEFEGDVEGRLQALIESRRHD